MFFESELKIQFPNASGSTSTIYLEGAETPDSFRGIYLDGVILDEVAQMPAGILEEILMPAMMERNGWGVMLGTPKGKNEFYRMYEKGMAKEGGEWSSHVYPVSKTKIFTEKQLASYRKQAGNAKYMQEYECSFESVIEGSFYGQTITEMREEGRIGTFPWNPKFPVITSWDLGSTNKTCIWFMQLIQNQIYIIDYAEGSGKNLPYYTDLLKSKPYLYSVLILPHDVKQNPFSVAGKSRLDEFRARGFKCFVAAKVGIMDGINATRNLLDRCFINEHPCKAGLDALFYYHSKKDVKLGVMEQEPVHDWSSDAADALRYGAIGIKPSMANPNHLITDSEIIKKMSSYDSFDPLDNF